MGGSTTGLLADHQAGKSLSSDAWILRLTPDGSVAWIRQLGTRTAAFIPTANGNPGGPGGESTGSESVADLALAPDGAILVAGSTTSNLAETNGGGVDLFVACFEPFGRPRWVRQVGMETVATLTPEAGETAWGQANASDFANSLVVHDDGRILVGGWTYSNLTAEGGGLGRPLLLELDPEGGVNWLRQLTSQQAQAIGYPVNKQLLSAPSIALLPSGEIVLGANFATDLGTLLVEEAIVIRYASNGTPLASTPTMSSLVIQDLTVDHTGRVYLACELNTSTGDGGEDRNAFVRCLEPSLATVWSSALDAFSAPSLGLIDSTKSELVGGIGIDARGFLVVVGSTAGALNEPTAGGFDLFTWKLERGDGSSILVHQFGQTTAAALGIDLSSNDFAGRLAPETTGSILVPGGTDGSIGAPNAGQTDLFVLRLNARGKL